MPKRWSKDDDGASLVEFAVLMPLLVLLVIGIVEFGWKFGQFNDVRHGAREGARFAAVNAGTELDITNHVCNSMDAISAGMTEIRVVATDGASEAIGDRATIRIESDVDSLTNVPFITTLLPGTLVSDVEFRLEQPSTNWDSFIDTCS